MALLAALETWGPVAAIRASPMLYAALNALHIIGLGILVGAILTLDLRVLGIWKADGWREAVSVSSPIAAAGLLLALSTGCLLFLMRPGHYLGNPPFLAKLGLVGFGLLNAALFHWRLRQSSGPEAGPMLRTFALMSVVTWMAAIFAGRFIAFVF